MRRIKRLVKLFEKEFNCHFEPITRYVYQGKKYRDKEWGYDSTYTKNQFWHIEIFDGYAREDFKEGIVAIDFRSTFNKISQCPIYCSINEPFENIVDMMKRLVELGEEFSNHIEHFYWCKKCKKWMIGGDKFSTHKNYEFFHGIQKKNGKEFFVKKCLKCGTIYQNELWK